MFFEDFPTKHTVIRDGRHKRVFERHYEGGSVRLVTKRTVAEQRRVRDRDYAGAAVGVLSWASVEPWEIAS